MPPYPENAADRLHARLLHAADIGVGQIRHRFGIAVKGRSPITPLMPWIQIQ